MQLQTFSIATLPNGTYAIAGNAVQVPRYRFEGKVYADDGQTLLQDFTGPAKALDFPECLTRLTPEDREEICRNLAMEVLQKLAV